MRTLRRRIKIDNIAALDFYLAGISSGLRDIKFCSMLNRELGLNLRRIDDWLVEHEDPASSHSHRSYLYVSKLKEEYRLISNKGEKYQLIPELKNIDYFLMVKHLSQASDYYYFLDQLRSLNEVYGVFNLEPSKLKSHCNLLY